MRHYVQARHIFPRVSEIIERHGGIGPGSPVENWTRLADVRNHVSRYGRSPANPNQAAKQPRSVAAWVIDVQQHPERDPELTRQLEAILADAAPPHGIGARKVRKPYPITLQNTEQLRGFLAEHGRLPNRDSDDPVEAKLGEWAYKLARTKNPYLPALEVITGVGGYRKLSRSTDFGAQLRSFIEREGRVPTCQPERTEAEQNLYQRMRRRITQRGVAERALVRQILCDYRDLPGVSGSREYRQLIHGEPLRTKSTTVARLQEMDRFLLDHQRLPSYDSSQSSEVRLRVWMSSYIHNSSTVTVERVRAALDAHRPRTKLAQSAQRVQRFVDRHARHPHLNSPDARERYLGWWLYYHCATHPNPYPAALRLLQAQSGLAQAA